MSFSVRRRVVPFQHSLWYFERHLRQHTTRSFSMWLRQLAQMVPILRVEWTALEARKRGENVLYKWLSYKSTEFIHNHFRHIHNEFPNRWEQIASSQVSIQFLLSRCFQARLGHPFRRNNRISVQNGQHFDGVIHSIASHQNCCDRSVHRARAHSETQLRLTHSIQMKQFVETYDNPTIQLYSIQTFAYMSGFHYCCSL